MIKYAAFVMALSILICVEPFAAEGVRVGVGFDYIPITKAKFVRNPESNYEIFDNILWRGQVSYDFGNGFMAGGFFDYYKKTIHPQSYLTTHLSLWDAGLSFIYGYELTDSGHTLLLGGAETGYARLTDKSGMVKTPAGAFTLTGLAGLRFMIAKRFWLETDYKLGLMDFGPITSREKKYLFSGSGLRLMLDYQIYSRIRNK
jgi:hypothetical protein